MRPAHWIQTELARHYEDLDLTKGADLDQNGKIEGSERTDLNDDGNVDSTEWQKFTTDNRAALEILGGQFKTYYSAGTAFKPDNPIHDLLSIESELTATNEIENAYEKVAWIKNRVVERLSEASLAPKEKMKLVYKLIVESGLNLDDQSGDGLARSIAKGGLDCDTSGLIVLAVAHELGWPVFGVSGPQHFFLRWDDGVGERFNMDYGESYSDEFVTAYLNIDPQSKADGVFLRNLGYDDLLSLFYQNRGMAKKDSGRILDAIADFDESIRFNKRYAIAFSSRGSTYKDLGRHEEAIADLNTALALNPNDADSYIDRADIKEALGMRDEAAKDYLKSIKAFSANEASRAKLFENTSEQTHETSKPYSCLCNTVGQPGNSSPSDPSLLSLILTVIFD
ncbi:MAG: tetratricopeptide repeat protein [bacterium]